MIKEYPQNLVDDRLAMYRKIILFFIVWYLFLINNKQCISLLLKEARYKTLGSTSPSGQLRSHHGPDSLVSIRYLSNDNGKMY